MLRIATYREYTYDLLHGISMCPPEAVLIAEAISLLEQPPITVPKVKVAVSPDLSQWKLL